MATTPETLLQEYAAGKRDFKHSYLSQANLSQKILPSADLGFSYLFGANLSASYLGYANLGYAFLAHAYLGYSNLSFSNLSYAYLCNADLSNSDLSNANFSYADLTNAKFNGATLKGANFTGAILKGADFKDAKFEGVILPDTPAPVLASGQFQVPAIDPAGVTFRNPINAEVTIVFTPSGTWSLAGYNNDAWVCTSAGRVGPTFDAHRPYSPYPAYLLGALVAGSNLSNTGTLIDGEKRIRMKPNETLTFLMNDNRNGYADNTGALTVAWKALATS